MRNPRVSVCMPVYNAARYLPEAIESVLSQNYADFELLIIDNCSEDGTAGIAGDFAARDERVVFKQNEVNLGMVGNWNRCLEEARGEYVKFVFGDDLLASTEALEMMVQVLDDDETVSLVGSARKVIDADGTVSRIISFFGDRSMVVDGHAVINRCLSTIENIIGEPTVVMFRKKQAGRGFDQKYRHAVDLEMWFHLLEQGRFAYLAPQLSAFRVHDEQATAVNKRNASYLDDNFYLLADYGDRSYITLTRFNRKYVYYDQCYKVWKEYRRGRIDKFTLFEKLDQYYDRRIFFLLLPWYKIFKPILRAKKGLAKFVP